MMSSTTKTLLLAAFCIASAGCYMEQPLQTPAPAPATRITAVLTDSGTVAMGNAIGSGAIAVEGVVANADERAWALQMIRVQHRDGRAIEWNREVVSFPRNVLTNPTVKVLDRKRSWLAAGAITLGAFIASRAFNLIGADEDDTQPPAPQEAVTIPFGGR